MDDLERQRELRRVREKIASLIPEERAEIEAECQRYAARLLREGLTGKVLPFPRKPS